MVNAHDLLWGMTLAHLPADAPVWVRAVIAAGHPVVVRRALAEPGYVAVGVRGRLREQRFAAVMPQAAVQRRVTPEALRGVISPRDLPALCALDQLRPVLACKVWGVTGSAGFELATGIEALHAQSDLDLLLRTPERLERGEAEALLAILDTAPCAVDLQLQTPYGAVALREWAGPARRVLLKTASGAQLVSDPWQAVA
ncbi:phosphoribosyl-dephospho-CoA transferase [Pseudomonas gessardii]|uniref:Malonate decarboxylase holo-ACP synthase n=1 Tax=Pseudomonas gessardii TaxID=78544 RepID=A0A7Y1MM97_9PSED|nr:malonate decarboxylase holo-ACP synthase [Pseudomonas gessardii]MRU51560.1 malonate decarboxylase holo-ACP synthase [Pseudomonas gessardii]NNA94753.1 malonate decarboxylase holo-ACP synthase [Pseudomonas gessardii]ONH41898.1 phosphoribosyl-dephospho-CoA transferase [Pseudomonas gessardii]SDR22582.1 phosphoribosyl-dephospho-CoA transferase [Pseudomonas gessardii]